MLYIFLARSKRKFTWRIDYNKRFWGREGGLRHWRENGWTFFRARDSSPCFILFLPFPPSSSFPFFPPSTRTVFFFFILSYSIRHSDGGPFFFFFLLSRLLSSQSANQRVHDHKRQSSTGIPLPKSQEKPVQSVRWRFFSHWLECPLLCFFSLKLVFFLSYFSGNIFIYNYKARWLVIQPNIGHMIYIFETCTNSRWWTIIATVLKYLIIRVVTTGYVSMASAWFFIFHTSKQKWIVCVFVRLKCPFFFSFLFFDCNNSLLKPPTADTQTIFTSSGNTFFSLLDLLLFVLNYSSEPISLIILSAEKLIVWDRWILRNDKFPSLGRISYRQNGFVPC